jgi:hypothetical protein
LVIFHTSEPNFFASPTGCKKSESRPQRVIKEIPNNWTKDQDFSYWQVTKFSREFNQHLYPRAWG